MTTIAYTGDWPAQKKYKDKNKEKLKATRNRTQEWEATKLRRMTPEGWAKERIPKLRHRAKKLGLDFDINWQDIVPQKLCPVFGVPFQLDSFGKPGAAHYAPSVDRIDNSKGYIKGNIKVISNRANLLKKDATKEELTLLVRYMEGKYFYDDNRI